MLCDICKKNEATIHIQEITNGQKKVIHMCQECAATQHGEGGLDFGPFNLAEVLYKLSGQSGAKPAPDASQNAPDNENAPDDADLVCDECGWTEEKLRKTGKLGCGHCYAVFAPLLGEAFKNMHRGLSHLGKHPAGNSENAELHICRARISKLQKELQQAVANEEYENAAVLRDRINELKQQCDRAAGKGERE